MTKENHPCDKCIFLRSDYITVNHGTDVELPLCDLDNTLAVVRCGEWESEE